MGKFTLHSWGTLRRLRACLKMRSVAVPGHSRPRRQLDFLALPTSLTWRNCFAGGRAHSVAGVSRQVLSSPNSAAPPIFHHSSPTLTLPASPQGDGLLLVGVCRVPIRNLLGLAVFATGIVLLISGFNEAQSFASEVSRLISDRPSNRTIWMFVAGGVAIIAGLTLALRNRRA